MRRRLTILIVFLLLGAVVNVAVAWGIWWWGEKPIPDPLTITGQPGTIASSEMESWNRCASAGWPEHPELAWDESFFGSRFRDLSTTTGSFDATGLSHEEWAERAKKRATYSVRIIECGWPQRSVALEMWYEFHYPTPFMWQTNGIRVGGTHLPNRPLWRGLAINTLLYALASWLLLLAGPRTLRGHIRRKRGWCVKCGYDLRGTPAPGMECGCPECGWNREEAKA